MQAQIRVLRLQDEEMYGLSEEVDLGEGHRSKYSLLDGRISKQLKTKSVRLQRIQWCALEVHATHIHVRPKLGKRIVLRISSGVRNVTNSMISQENLCKHSAPRAPHSSRVQHPHGHGHLLHGSSRALRCLCRKQVAEYQPERYLAQHERSVNASHIGRLSKSTQSFSNL